MKKKEKTEKQDNTNLPQLPKNWKWVKLGEVAYLKNGYAFKSEDYADAGIPLIRISDINKEEAVDLANSVKIQKDKIQPEYFVSPGDILIAMSGATTGKFGVYRGIQEALQNQRVGNFKVYNEQVLNKTFFFYIIHNIKQTIEKKAYGGAQPNISPTIIEDIDIPLPPLSEQQRIVTRIEEKFSEIDHGIEKLKMVRSQLKMYRQSVLKAAFEGKLGLGNETTNLVQEVLESSHENATPSSKKSEATASSKKQIAPLTKAEIADLPQLPKDWKWVKLESILEVKDGTHDTPEYVEKGIPFITQKNIKENGLSFDDIKYISIIDHDKFFKRSNVNYGDILISMIGANRGMSCIVNDQRVFSIKNVGLIKANYQAINQYFLLYFLKSSQAINHVKEVSKGGAQQFIGLTELRNFPIPNPPTLEIQNVIVDAIDVRLSKAETSEKVVEENLNNAEKLKQSILTKAFQGGLSEQLETDENVEEMLQQLSVEKDDLMTKNQKIEKKITLNEEQREILEILKDKRKYIPAREVWLGSIYKDDIELFYEKLKVHINNGEIIEKRKGKESLLGLSG